MTTEINNSMKKDSFLFLGTTNQRKHLPSAFRFPHHVADVLGRCWCFYLQYTPPDHHLSHNKNQFQFTRQRVNGCQGHSWKATAVWIVSRWRSRQLIIVSLAHSQIMIPIDKESRLLIAPHFINFAPQGLLVAMAAAVTHSAILLR